MLNSKQVCYRQTLYLVSSADEDLRGRNVSGSDFVLLAKIVNIYIYNIELCIAYWLWTSMLIYTTPDSATPIASNGSYSKETTT